MFTELTTSTTGLLLTFRVSNIESFLNGHNLCMCGEEQCCNSNLCVLMCSWCD